MTSHQNPPELLPAGDSPAWGRLTKSQEQENIIINRPARSTYPRDKSVLTSAATPHHNTPFTIVLPPRTHCASVLKIDDDGVKCCLRGVGCASTKRDEFARLWASQTLKC